MEERARRVGPARIDMCVRTHGKSRWTRGAADQGDRGAVDPLAGRVLRGAGGPRVAGDPVRHGLADRLCDVSGGRATAEAIRGAELVVVEGMGHDLPPGLRTGLAERIAQFVRGVES
jgi:pimeloyl-ACP methyl ester carboxylesterase